MGIVGGLLIGWILGGLFGWVIRLFKQPQKEKEINL